MRSGIENLPKVFLHNNIEQINYYFSFGLSQKEEMRRVTKF
jgi:hypothetical protein